MLESNLTGNLESSRGIGISSRCLVPAATYLRLSLTDTTLSDALIEIVENNRLMRRLRFGSNDTVVSQLIS